MEISEEQYHLCIDGGNSSIKCRKFSQGRAVGQTLSWDISAWDGLISFIETEPNLSQIGLSVVGRLPKEFYEALRGIGLPICHIGEGTALPFETDYNRRTIGSDRLAAVAATIEEYAPMYPESAFLVIDAGTALTLDYIDKNLRHKGGCISPGLSTRFNALHSATAALPQVDIERSDIHLYGTNTQDAIRFGVQNGTIFEILGYISHFQQEGEPLVSILTGGEVEVLGLEEKTSATIIYEPDLVFKGIESIIKYNQPRR